MRSHAVIKFSPARRQKVQIKRVCKQPLEGLISVNRDKSKKILYNDQELLKYNIQYNQIKEKSISNNMNKSRIEIVSKIMSNQQRLSEQVKMTKNQHNHNDKNNLMTKNNLVNNTKVEQINKKKIFMIENKSTQQQQHKTYSSVTIDLEQDQMISDENCLCGSKLNKSKNNSGKQQQEKHLMTRKNSNQIQKKQQQQNSSTIEIIPSKINRQIIELPLMHFLNNKESNSIKQKNHHNHKNKIFQVTKRNDNISTIQKQNQHLEQSQVYSVLKEQPLFQYSNNIKSMNNQNKTEIDILKSSKRKGQLMLDVQIITFPKCTPQIYCKHTSYFHD